MVHEIANQSIVLSTARRVLKPLARLLLSNGITFPAIAELFKQVLVEVADQDFPVQGKVTTDSRISVLTGVHRKDVKRLRQLQPSRENIPKTVSLGNQVVNTWLTEEKWLSTDKTPRILPKVSSEAGESGFDALCESISKDVRPRAILDELARIGAVEVMDDRVLLNVEAFIPKTGQQEKLYFLERGVYSHLMAAVNNVQTESPSYIDRMVYYDTIPEASLDVLRDLIEKEGMNCLRKINDSASRHSLPDGDRQQHITVGLYYYHEPVDKTRDESA